MGIIIFFIFGTDNIQSVDFHPDDTGQVSEPL